MITHLKIHSIIKQTPSNRENDKVKADINPLMTQINKINV